MKHPAKNASVTAPLFPCKGNLPKVKWRDVLAQIAKPAVQVHEYRNVRSAIFYDAIFKYDCGKQS
jgi:hypothetical protein